MNPTILVAEHDPASQYVLEMTLRQRVSCKVCNVKYGYELFEQLKKQSDVALVICDINLPDMSGVEVVTQLKRTHASVPVVVAAGVRDGDATKEAMRRGAIDFIRKADAPARIAQLINNILHEGPVRSPSGVAEAEDRADQKTIGFDSLVGSSESLKNVIESARQAANSDIPVLLHGESGVGKERFARAIHCGSVRANASFVAVNCGAIPENLVESTLFGHEKGAFTGAVEGSIGKFGEAEGGTLFLDELGELKPDIQVKLLRALQEKEVTPVGGKVRKLDVRIVSATNLDLGLAVKEQRFREDLYYRLNVFPLEIPPLRQRGEGDVRALVQHFTKYFAKQEGKTIKKVSDAAIAMLLTYEWPGNIRQLENAVYRAVVMAENDMLRVEDFMQISNALHETQLMCQRERPEPNEEVRSATVEREEERNQVSLVDGDGNFRSLRDVEAEILKKALGYYRWHITNIAAALGITRATVYKKMKQAGLEDPRSGYGN